MAMLRRQAEQQQQANLETQQQQQQQQHFSKYDNPATTELCAQRQQRPQLTEPEPPAAPTCYGATSKKYHQLKRKSHESRQKLLQLSKQQLLKLSHKPHLLPAAKKAISCSTQTTPHSNISYNWRSPLLQQQQHQQQQQQSATAAEIFADQHYQHIRDDYRKNLFGTIKLQHSSCSPPSSSHRGCSHQNRVQQPVVTLADDSNITGVKSDSNDCLQFISSSAAEDEVSFIVNEAFDEIFADYSCADDDDENGVPPEGAAIRNVGDRSEPDGRPEDVMICKPVRRTTTTLASNEFGRAERAPKRLLSAHKKAAPAPPSPSHLVATNTSSQSNLKQPMLKQQKRRASKLSRFLEGIKYLPRSKHAFYKIPADSLLRDDLHAEAQVQVPSSVLLRYSQQPRLRHRNSAHAEAGGLPRVADDSHLLRGTTLSQSFVRQLRKRCSKERRPEKRTSKKTAAPPVPTAVTKSAPRKPASPPDANRQRGPQVMLFPKQRLKSSTDLLLDELISTQRQRYCRKNDHNFVDASGGDGSGESRRNNDAEGDKKNLMSFKPHDDYVSAEI